MLTPSQRYTEMHASSSSTTIDVSQPSQNIQQQPQQLEDPAIRNARVRLDYKKSFDDDLLFFPEPRLPESSYRTYDPPIPVEMAGYISPDSFSFTSNNMNNQTFFAQKQNQYSHQQQPQKENLLSVLAFKSLEKQQQQQQDHQQQHRYLHNQAGAQPYQIRRGGQTYYPQNHQLHQNQQHHNQNQQQQPHHHQNQQHHQQQQQHFGEPYSVNQNVFNYANLRARN